MQGDNTLEIYVQDMNGDYQEPTPTMPIQEETCKQCWFKWVLVAFSALGIYKYFSKPKRRKRTSRKRRRY